jgi:hypothetical protein
MKSPLRFSFLFWILLALVVVSCQEDAIESNEEETNEEVINEEESNEEENNEEENKYDVVQINEVFVLNNLNDCYYLDLNSNGENDIGICKNFYSSSGGAYSGSNYIEIINSSLQIATTETFDSIYSCVYETTTYDCYYNAMNESHSNCPDNAEYSVTALNDQGYPTVIDSISQILDNHTYTNTATLLHSFDLSNAFGCFVTDYKREYWVNKNEKFLAFKITEDGNAKNGYIKLSVSFILENYDIKEDETIIHEIGLEKD